MQLIIHQTPAEIIHSFGANGAESIAIKEQIRSAGCWGFIEDSKIHCFYRNDAEDRNIIELFAHEMSHRNEKGLKKLAGENFATQNAATFLKAYDLFLKIRR